MVTMLSSRLFNQDTGRAKKASLSGPVIITDRGRPSHVLLSIEEYRRVCGEKRSIHDLLSMPGSEKVEFSPKPLDGTLFRPAKF